jgi:hypothetical protein
MRRVPSAPWTPGPDQHLWVSWVLQGDEQCPWPPPTPCQELPLPRQSLMSLDTAPCPLRTQSSPGEDNRSSGHTRDCTGYPGRSYFVQQAKEEGWPLQPVEPVLPPPVWPRPCLRPDRGIQRASLNFVPVTAQWCDPISGWGWGQQP